mmetsp:Transcript_22472/g.60775  ORF Transcript_22472/g.60775 Transcript_22472/m.60775 type:complete len:244 (+) Transcript_22472:1015-1746(+)
MLPSPSAPASPMLSAPTPSAAGSCSSSRFSSSKSSMFGRSSSSLARPSAAVSPASVRAVAKSEAAPARAVAGSGGLSMLPRSGNASSASPVLAVAVPVVVHPSSSISPSPAPACSISSVAAMSALARCRQGTFRVMRNCLSTGRWGRTFDWSPALHCHVGHLRTSMSPAVTNSSGVSMPLSWNCDSVMTGAKYSAVLSAYDLTDCGTTADTAPLIVCMASGWEELGVEPCPSAFRSVCQAGHE